MRYAGERSCGRGAKACCPCGEKKRKLTTSAIRRDARHGARRIEEACEEASVWAILERWARERGPGKTGTAAIREGFCSLGGQGNAWLKRASQMNSGLMRL